MSAAGFELMPVDVFREIGESLDRRWSRYSRNPRVFPALAAQALAETDRWQSVRVEDVVDWVLAREHTPPLGQFASPAITTYRSEDFIIQLLFWTNTPTAIHQHRFSGAWGVLLGSSCHCEYTFTLSEQLAPQLALGDLAFKSAEHLTKGCVREIPPGSAFIHALLHLDCPSISVVIRTGHDPAYEPYDFLKPGLAFDPWFQTEPLRTQIALLRSINGVRPDLFEQAALRIIESPDLWGAQSIIRLREKDPIRNSTLSKLLSRLRQRHARLAETLSAALRQRDRFSFAIQAMGATTDPDLRFFLALLIHGPDPQTIRHLIGERYPGADPDEKLAEWFTQIARVRSIPLSCANPGALLRLAMQGAAFDEAVRRFGYSDAERISDLRADWHKLQSLEWLQPLFPRASNVSAA